MPRSVGPGRPRPSGDVWAPSGLDQQRQHVPGTGSSELLRRAATDQKRARDLGEADPGRGRVVGEWASPHCCGPVPATSTLIKGQQRRFSESMTSCSSFLPRLNTAPTVVQHVKAALGSPGPRPAAVVVRGASLSYSRSGPRVLDCLSMTVEAGHIYGLLGASGCGKTSLLGVLVGRRRLQGGLVQVLGGRPRPGRRLGYMPQELALYGEFTILETLQYFGRLHGMAAQEALRQLDFLTELLDLPAAGRTVATLSGGQARRVSLAVSLLHSPDLLILDEPTVGVDPVLRQKVWAHLASLARGHACTVIITTHYIEEAREADRVGLMRGGRLLAEAAPSHLLHQHGLPSLEAVFLRLCVSDGEGHDPPGLPILGPPPLVDPVVAALGRQLEKAEQAGLEQERDRGKRWCPGATNMHALLVKNLLKLRRNPAMLLFVFLLPAIQVVFFCVSIGQEPRGLALGIVNYESGGSCPDLPAAGCVLTDLGCRMFPSDERVEVVPYSTERAGLAEVRAGALWGLLVIQADFTPRLLARLGGGGNASAGAVPGLGQVAAHMDMSNQQVALSLQRWVLQSLANSTASLLATCRLPASLQQEPVLWRDPVYGEMEPSFTEFMAPGIIILIIYFLAVALTGESFISERAGGLLERSWVAGVTPAQVLASHILVQFAVMAIQTVVTLSTIIFGFGIPCRGPLPWLAALTMLQGLAGMSFGFLISSLCDSQAVAMQLSIGSFYPNLLLSGILWPLEGMPSALQYIARFLPNTLACQAMRDIMLRGWGVDRPEVYYGLVSSSIWISIFLCLSWTVVRFKS